MTTYAQTTIHSKIARGQKAPGEGSLGKVIKGTLTTFGKVNRSLNKTQDAPEILREVQILPKTRTNVNRKMRNKIIPSVYRKDEIILMQSSVFPAIYFKKTTMRNVLKQFNFPENVRALPPTDDRMTLIFQIISNLFNEINFYIFNILIGENLITQSFYVFFSDSETIPFTKCCNAPVYIELMNNGSGKILCNSLKCPHSNLAEFLINFQDGKKLWKNITYFSQASEKDKILRHRISKLINNGRFKRMSLVNVVQQTSKEIVDLFYDFKQNKIQNREQEGEGEEVDEEFKDTPFLTAGQHVDRKKQSRQSEQDNQIQQQQQFQGDDELVNQQQKNIDLIKMKLEYITKATGPQISKRVTKSIINQGKVFHKNFDMIRKIDEFMLGQKNSKTTTRISFPKIMDQMKKKQRQLNKTAKSQSMYNSNYV